MDQYKDFRIHLWSFDTAVFNPKVFTPDNADELLDYELGSGGGTECECNWYYMKEQGITLITVSHRDTLWKYHTHLLRFCGDKDFEFGKMPQEQLDKRK